jgi:hypothetical protein
MAATDQQVQTVEIPEPSDKHEVAHDEKPCFTKKHLYIAIGVVFVVAISLIGSLLDFSPSDDGVTEQSITQAITEDWHLYDLNGDGFVDKAEFTTWATGRIAARKKYCTEADPEPTLTVANSDGSNGSEPQAQEVDTYFNPCDYNQDGRLSLGEAIICAIKALLEALKRRRQNQDLPMPVMPMASQAMKVQDENCPVPRLPGFPGRVRGPGYVGACQPDQQLWVYSSWCCRRRRGCHRNIIEVSWTYTSTCCGNDQAANCTDCTCGGSYRYVPRGRHARARGLCHWLSTYHCGEVDTNVPCW